MKIFISHSHQNDNAAKALVDFLLSSLSLEDSDIRCTSVPGHQLRFGKSIAELLKADISEAPVLIAMISKESVGSDWVLFELGAAWGLNRDLYPILGPSLQIKDLPGPLSAVPCVEIESPDAPSRMSDLVQQLAEDLQVATRNGGKAQANLDNFLKQYKSGPKSTASTGSSLTKAENAEDTILLVIWRLHESEYDEHGYSLEAISRLASLSIPKCEHILNDLVKKKFVDKKKWVGGINGTRYLLDEYGRNYLLQNKFVE